MGSVIRLSDVSRFDKEVLFSSAMANGNPLLLYAASLAKSARRTVFSAAKKFAVLMSDGEEREGSYPWHTVTPSQIAYFAVYMRDNYAQNTAMVYVNAVRGIMRACVALGTMAKEQYDACSPFKVKKNLGEPAGRALHDEEIRKLFLSIPTTAFGIRDIAMIALGLETGARTCELVGVEIKDLDLGNKTVIYRKAKGGRVRVCPYIRSEAYIDQWLKRRGMAPGPLFCAIYEGNIFPEKPRRGRFRKMLAAYMKRAGLKHASPHDLRRTFISRGLEGGDQVTVADMVGHSDLNMTRRYDRRLKAKEKLVAGLDYPF